MSGSTGRTPSSARLTAWGTEVPVVHSSSSYVDHRGSSAFDIKRPRQKRPLRPPSHRRTQIQLRLIIIRAVQPLRSISCLMMPTPKLHRTTPAAPRQPRHALASVAASILPKYQRYLYHLPTHTLPTSAYRGQARRSTIHPTAEMHNQPYASPNAWCDEAPKNTTSPGMSMLFHKPRHQQADPLPDFTKSLGTSHPDAPANSRFYWRPVPTSHDQSHMAGTPGAPYTVSKKPDERGAMEQQLQASPNEATLVF